MPNFKGVLAGLAISTALAGGIVSLGAATTTATAGASTVTAGASVINCGGGGCGWRRGCCHRSCCHQPPANRHHQSCHSSHHRRFKLNVNINNNTVNGA